MKKIYRARCYWQEYAIVSITAENKEQAIEKLHNGPLPGGEYVSESFEIDEIEETKGA